MNDEYMNIHAEHCKFYTQIPILIGKPNSFEHIAFSTFCAFIFIFHAAKQLTRYEFSNESIAKHY